jgi:dTDP-4-dehydrorhamnose 3,5-epimerase
MRIEPTQMPGLKLMVARTFPDDRGCLVQSWVKTGLDSLGIPSGFRQAIQTNSRRGAVRGLHFQWDPPMGKYIRCIVGRFLDVTVDIRQGSPTLGRHVAIELSDRNHQALWIPPGLAHGIFAIEDSIALYECTAEYTPGSEGGIRWDDPALGIEWPDMPVLVSEKDRTAPTLAEWLADPRSRCFQFA